MPAIVPQKTCSKCKQFFLAVAEFWHKNKSRKDGFSDTCKECAKARARQWSADNPQRAKQNAAEYYLENREHIKSRVKSRADSNPEMISAANADYYQRNREECDARNQAWALANPERAKQIKQDYIKRHPERRKKSSMDWLNKNRERSRKNGRNWRKNNPDKTKAYYHARRSRERSAEGTFSAEDIRIAYRSQRGKCWHCGCKVDNHFHADHLVPLKHGGASWPNNIVVSCSDCNLKKGAKLCYQWNGRLF